jgi:hypothetical protein
MKNTLFGIAALSLIAFPTLAQDVPSIKRIPILPNGQSVQQQHPQPQPLDCHSINETEKKMKDEGYKILFLGKNLHEDLVILFQHPTDNDWYMFLVPVDSQGKTACVMSDGHRSDTIIPKDIGKHV